MEGRGQGLPHPFGGLGPSFGAGVLQEDGELIPAEPGDRVGRPHRSPQAFGHRQEQLVPGGVAEAVVHGLEPVEIEEQDRGGRPAALGAGQCVGHPVDEQGPVGQGRERIMERLAGEFGLQVLAFGDVVDEGVEDVARSEPGGPHGQFHGELPPVAGLAVQLQPLAEDGGLPGGQEPPEALAVGRAERRRDDQVGHRLAGGLLP